MKKINTDIIIIGAGIAGLWLHHRLNDMGYHAVLIEKNALGAGQTLSSQGIIHGGAKYTLHGMLSNAASAIAEMPSRWISCLEGRGDIDLSNTQILSHHQCMWSTQDLSSKITSFFSSKVLNGKIKPLRQQQYPDFFKDRAFKGKLYQLNEPVLDVPSLVENLSLKWRHRMLHLSEGYHFTHHPDQRIQSLITEDGLSITANEYILTSGEGNEALLSQLPIRTPSMQRRPLQMVLAKGKHLPSLYAHCVGASTKPIATISTHSHPDGDTVWYIGGNIAEEGTGVNSQQLIADTRNTLNKILPWANLENTQWATHTVNRAEPEQKNLLRPDTAFLESTHNLHIGWPTKLALTPNLSDKVIQTLSDNNTIKSPRQTQEDNDALLHALMKTHAVAISKTLWERAFHAKN
jgi:glycine/D-amino acid oxidase-like deaminating enzyme